MTVSEWARQEVKIAVEREIANSNSENEKNFAENYSRSCYESALKAYESLLEAEHSGASYEVTASILKRLLDNKPLTAIAADENVWQLMYEDDREQRFQCTRCFSFFKTCDKKTGETVYSDINRFICKDPDGHRYHNGFIQRQLDKKYPITLPYYPKKEYLVDVFDFSMSAEPGVFDTILIHSVKEPDGSERILNMCFKETESGFESISDIEYYDRYACYKRNREKKRHEQTPTV